MGEEKGTQTDEVGRKVTANRGQRDSLEQVINTKRENTRRNNALRNNKKLNQETLKQRLEEMGMDDEPFSNNISCLIGEMMETAQKLIPHALEIPEDELVLNEFAIKTLIFQAFIRKTRDED